jgi:hypothetical protein
LGGGEVMDLKRLDWILTKAQDIDLTSWEENFIGDLTDRREDEGDRIRISEKQEEILERIASK